MTLDKKCTNCANNVLPSNCPACMECNNEDQHVPALNKTEEEQMREDFDNWHFQHFGWKDKPKFDTADAAQRFEVWQAAIAHANSKHSAILEDRERLAAKLVEKLTADCNFLHSKNQRLDNLLHDRDEQLSATNAAIATLRNRISTIAENCPHTEYDPDCTGTGNADDAYDHGSDMARSVVGDELRELLGNPTLQASEWEEKKLEPLRKQVAMLNNVVDNVLCDWDIDDDHIFTDTISKMREAVINTQAAADQFVAEIEQRGAVKAPATAQPPIPPDVAELQRQLEEARKVPEGWKLVPIEPTEKMIEDAWPVSNWDSEHQLHEVYRTMLASAPQPNNQHISYTEEVSKQLWNPEKAT